MLANERLLKKMSLEQKLKFITSPTLYETAEVDSYSFPVLKFGVHEFKDTVATQFPSERNLAATWNMQLVGDAFRAIAAECRVVNSYEYFGASNDVEYDDVTSDYYLKGRYYVEKIRGLTTGRQPVNFDVCTSEHPEVAQLRRMLCDEVMANCRPDSVILKRPEDMNDFGTRYKYHNAYFGVATSVKECLQYLLGGCVLVFLYGEGILEELLNVLPERIDAYKNAYAAFRAGKMSVSDFDASVRRFDIFDGEIIDKACDKLLNVLVKMKSEEVMERPLMTGLEQGRETYIDEITHDAVALEAARQSAILLKNEKILPIGHSVNVAVLGEYANNYSYQQQYFTAKPTVKRLPFEDINRYELTTVGYCAGYARGEVGRTDLLHTACNLCQKADVAIVYLAAKPGEKSLPPEQLELLSALHGRAVKIIAVVAADEYIDFSFDYMCAAVLFTGNGGQEAVIAALDIITGKQSPSGRLVEGILSYAGGELQEKYPKGYGLSYAKFEYKNLRVNHGGISFTVRNTSRYDSFAVPQLYIRKTDSPNYFSTKILKGFAKVFVAAGDSQRVEIPFDENTFRVYNDKKNVYFIEGGEYEIFVSENYSKDRLTGTVTLKDFTFDREFVNKQVDFKNDNIRFSETREQREMRKSKQKLSYGLCLFIAAIIAVYCNAMLGIVAFTNLIVQSKGMAFYIVMGGIAVIIDGLLLVYILRLNKLKKKQTQPVVNDVLTDMVDKIGEFTEVAKVTYAEPTEDEAEIEEVAAETAGEEEETAPVAVDYDMSFASSNEEIKFTEHVSLAEICANFKNFVATYGINLDPSSARAFMGAYASSKLMVLTSKNPDVLPKFVEAVNGYFGNTESIVAGDDWSAPDDLYWTKDGNKYAVSPFINAVHMAADTPEKNCAVVLQNVKGDTVMSYFGKFVDFAIHPSEEVSLQLNDELSFKLPKNECYILVPVGGSGENLPPEIANIAIQVDVILNTLDAPAEPVEIKNVTSEDFTNLVKDARETAFLSERLWKKIDEMFVTIGEKEKFVFGNKNTLQVERLTSFIMDCGGDEGEALTAAFLYKFVPLLKNTRTYAQDNGETAIFQIISKLFPDEELTKIQRALVKVGKYEA